MIAVTIGTKGDMLEPGTPMLLFERHFAMYTGPPSDAWYDVGSDGQHSLDVETRGCPQTAPPPFFWPGLCAPIESEHPAPPPAGEVAKVAQISPGNREFPGERPTAVSFFQSIEERSESCIFGLAWKVAVGPVSRGHRSCWTESEAPSGFATTVREPKKHTSAGSATRDFPSQAASRRNGRCRSTAVPDGSGGGTERRRFNAESGAERLGFLYREVLQSPLGKMQPFVRAKRPKNTNMLDRPTR